MAIVIYIYIYTDIVYITIYSIIYNIFHILTLYIKWKVSDSMVFNFLKLNTLRTRYIKAKFSLKKFLD